MNKAITDGLVLMPPAFEDGLTVWSSGDGTPGSDTYDGDPNAAFVPADQDFGGCLELQKVDGVQKLRFMGETPLLPGCYLRVRARLKAVSGNLPDVRIAGWAGDGANAHVPGLIEVGPSTTLTTYGDVVEVSAIVGSGARGGVDMVWGMDATYGHFGLDLTGSNGGVVRIDDLIIEDITSVFAGQMMDWVDVTDFGAIGDGVADNVAAFEAADAAAAGRAVLVPEGDFYLADHVTFENRVRFVGTVTMDDEKRLTLTKNYTLPDYISAFGSELLALKKAIQVLFQSLGDMDYPGQATDPDYWVDHVRKTVRFADGLTCLGELESFRLVEVGPGRTLATLATRNLGRSQKPPLTSLPHPRENRRADAVLLETLGQLWAEGTPVDWNAFYGAEKRLRVPLPTYPFQRRRYWLEGSEGLSEAQATPKAKPLVASQPRPALETDYAAPSGAFETQIAAIWSDMLGIAQIGIHDDFFALGGDSLLATQILSRMRSRFDREITVAALLENPTVAALARVVERDGGSGGEPHQPALVPVSRDEPIPLSFAQMRVWMIDTMAGGSPFFNIPFAFKLTGPFSRFAMDRALARVVDRHESLRTRFKMVRGQPIQLVEDHWSSPLPVIDLRRLGPERGMRVFKKAAEAETKRVFDLKQCPLFRWLLFQLGDREHILFFNLHHMITDGWSWRVLFKELRVLYRDLLLDQGSSLPPLPIQYGDYAAWQRQWLSGETRDRLLTYWKTRLEGPLPLFPNDHRRPEKPDFKGVPVALHLSAELVTRLKTFCRQENLTLFMVLLAAFKAAMRAYSKSDDVLVGTPIANRNREETESLIGFFVNTLVLRSQVSGDLCVRDLVRVVKDTATEAFAHQDFPYQEIVTALNPERETNRHPIFQVMFTFQNVPESKLAFAGVEAEPVSAAAEDVMVDLSFAARERDGVVRGVLLYQEALFDHASIEAIANFYRRLLEAMTREPERKLESFPFVVPPTEDERPHEPPFSASKKHQLDVLQEGLRSVPIGRPFEDYQVYILDERLNPLPIGIPGELYLGGAGLARGYLKRPALTASRFLPNPHVADLDLAPGARLYRSGDLACFLEDGNVELLGRMDEQIKIRGFRVELGEIESALEAHWAVKQALVMAREVKPGDKRLVAYVTVEGTPEEELKPELNAFLGERLPDYMVPSALVQLEQFPLNANGKVDRGALPPPREEMAQRQVVAPRDSLEYQLVSLWERVLGTQPIGIDDNFFDLGGHSLLSLVLMSEIEEQTGIYLSVTSLFEGPTIAQLAELLRQRRADLPVSPLVNIRSEGQGAPLYLIHPISGDMLIYGEMIKHLPETRLLFGLESLGLEGSAEPLRRVEDMATAYLDAIEAQNQKAPIVLVGASLGGIIALEMMRLLVARNRRAACVLLDCTLALCGAEPKPDQIALTFCRLLDHPVEIKMNRTLDHFTGLDENDHVEHILEAARTAGMVSSEREARHLRRRFAVFKANYEAACAYKPRSFAAKPLLLLAEDDLANPALASVAATYEPYGIAVETGTIPGNHFNMMMDPNVAVLAQKLERAITAMEQSPEHGGQSVVTSQAQTLRHLVIAVLGSKGDLFPFLQLGKALVSQKVDITVLGNEELAEEVGRLGFRFHCILAKEATAQMENHPDFLHPDRGPAVFAQHMVLPATKPAYEFLNSESFGPGTVILAQTRVLGARLAAEALTIPMLTTCLTPYEFEHALGTGPKQVDALLTEPLARMRSEYGLNPLEGPIFPWLFSPDGVLALFPKWYAESADHWPGPATMVGFIETENETPLHPMVEEFLDQGEPPLVFIPGTFNYEGELFFREALKLGRRAIFISPDAAPEPRKVTPKIIQCHFLPLADLLPRSSVLIHHGGMGTAAAALRAGTPQVVVPRAYDQIDQATRLEALGVAKIIQPDQYNKPNLAKAINCVLGDPETKEPCGCLAKNFKNKNPIVEASRILKKAAEKGA